MKPLIIIGSGGHAKVCIDACEQGNEYSIIGLIDDFKEVNEEVYNYKILGKISDVQLLNETIECEFFIAIGDNYQREKIFFSLRDLHLKWANIIHPASLVSEYAQITYGVIIMPAVIVNAGSKINPFCILNTGAQLDHDCEMGEVSSLAPGVITGGNVKIGAGTAIGMGSIIRNNIKIGDNTVIGCGSLVLDDIKDNKLAFGSPCREIRNRERTEKYL